MSQQSQKTNFIATKFYYVAIKPKDKLISNKVLLCHNKAKDKTKDKLCHDKVILCCNKAKDRPKDKFCCDIVLGVTNADVVTLEC